MKNRLKLLLSILFVIASAPAHSALITYESDEIGVLSLDGVSISFLDFYGYNGTSATTGLEVTNSVIMFFAELNGDNALFLIANKFRDGGDNGSLDVSISSSTGAIEFVDDAKEASSTGFFSFNWGGNLTDGFIFSGLADEFEISLSLSSTKGIDGAYVLDFTDGNFSSAEYGPLLSLEEGPFEFRAGNFTEVPEPSALFILGLALLGVSRFFKK